MTDFRKLCQDLLDELQYQTNWSTLIRAEDLQERALAALAEPEPEPVAWMYQGEPSFDGTDWQETWEVTTDKRLAEFKATPNQPIPLFSIHPQLQ